MFPFIDTSWADGPLACLERAALSILMSIDLYRAETTVAETPDGKVETTELFHSGTGVRAARRIRRSDRQGKPISESEEWFDANGATIQKKELKYEDGTLIDRDFQRIEKRVIREWIWDELEGGVLVRRLLVKRDAAGKETERIREHYEGGRCVHRDFQVPTGRVRTADYSYDAQGRLVTTTERDDSRKVVRVITIAYLADGSQQITTTDYRYSPARTSTVTVAPDGTIR